MNKEQYLKRWPIIEDILKREGIVRQHINSFNDFFDNSIQQIVDNIDDIVIDNDKYSYSIRFGKVKIGKPTLNELDGSTTFTTPAETRMRDVTYMSPIKVELSIIENGKVIESRYVFIGNLPIMVKSKGCILYNFNKEELINHGEDPNDPGGYFIVNGSERVLIGREEITPNKMVASINKKGTSTEYNVSIDVIKDGFKMKHTFSMKDDFILAHLRNVATPIPITVLLKALGMKSDKDIVTSISMNDDIQDLLDDTFDRTSDVTSTELAHEYIMKRVMPNMPRDKAIQKLNNILDYNMLSNIGRSTEHRKEKAIIICEAINKLLELRLGWIEADDRDHFGNKIIDFAGQSLKILFEYQLKKLVRDIKYQMGKSIHRRGLNAVESSIRPGMITDKLQHSISTGKWPNSDISMTEPVERTNYLTTIASLRKIQSRLNHTQSNFNARALHASQFGRICPSETPEGAKCGLTKNLSLLGIISTSVPKSEIIEKLYDDGVVHAFETNDNIKNNGTRVFVDGILIGYHENGEEFTKKLREYRRKLKIHPHTSISFHIPKNEHATRRLFIDCNPGRIMRPLIVIDNNKPLLSNTLIDKISKKILSWTDLLRMGVIELIDANEEEDCYITIDENDINGHTHLEIYPPAMLGVCASIIPYPEHNQSPRNTYESAMVKQSQGFATPLVLSDTYTQQYMLLYPQTPIVNTKSMDLLHINERPVGQNCVVAVLPYDGYNIEDAIVLSKSSVDRGLGRTFYYKSYKVEAKQYPMGQQDKICIPNEDDNIRSYRGEHFYRLLEEDGVISVDSKVKNSDILVGVTSPMKNMNVVDDIQRKDTSVSTEINGIVDAVIMSQSGDGNKLYKIRIRDMRVPEIGDKFASRHGQKGVVGMLVNDEDLPYTAQGITPDVMINPHAFPSRMTVGMLMESVCGKASVLRGKSVDGTAFIGEKINDVKDVMKEYGFDYSGKEIMYDGRTGKKFPVDVFIGVVYYQRLKHMVLDKVHARSKGQIQTLTKQPTEGRTKKGGLRFGEMERDCLIAYGASMQIKDRLLYESDKTNFNICERCGLIAYYDNRQRKHVCRICGDLARISEVTMSYAFKLLIQELQSFSVTSRLLLRDKVK